MDCFNNDNNKASTEAKSRYANILLDYWFKRSFGTEMNKRLMILFLKEIIPEAHVKDISYSNKEHINPFPDEHGVVVDIEATSDDGSRFIVEMQLAPQNHFMERTLFYSSFAIQEQIAKGSGSYAFMPVYFIALMNFSIHKAKGGKFLFRYEITERDSGELMTDRIRFLFLELPNVKQITDGSTDLEKLCYALHNMTVLQSRPPEMKAEIFELLFDSAEIAKFTPKEKVMYENDMRTERDLRNQLEYSHEQGVIKGLAKGRAKGREEERLKSIEEKGRIARALLDNGVPPEVVEKAVGIKIPEVQGDRE